MAAGDKPLASFAVRHASAIAWAGPSSSARKAAMASVTSSWPVESGEGFDLAAVGVAGVLAAI
jgi:hypothetical protein